MHKFSDFAENECPFDGEKIPMKDLLNKEICLIGFRITVSKFFKDKSCLHLHFELNGIRHVAFTNSCVLMKQSEKYKEHLPFITTIIQKNRYYTFS